MILGGLRPGQIRGSGHMVPEFRPKQTLEWLRRWLGDEDWQRYARPA